MVAQTKTSGLRSKYIIFIAASLVTVIVLLSGYLYITGRVGVPKNVSAAYDEATHNNRYADLRICRKGFTIIYTIGGGSGFYGQLTYFDWRGHSLGEEFYTDAPGLEVAPPEPPININQFSCNTIRSEINP